MLRETVDGVAVLATGAPPFAVPSETPIIVVSHQVRYDT